LGRRGGPGPNQKIPVSILLWNNPVQRRNPRCPKIPHPRNGKSCSPKATASISIAPLPILESRQVSSGSIGDQDHAASSTSNDGCYRPQESNYYNSGIPWGKDRNRLTAARCNTRRWIEVWGDRSVLGSAIVPYRGAKDIWSSSRGAKRSGCRWQ
jgi:hypothetical protein